MNTSKQIILYYEFGPDSKYFVDASRSTPVSYCIVHCKDGSQYIVHHMRFELMNFDNQPLVYGFHHFDNDTCTLKYDSLVQSLKTHY